MQVLDITEVKLEYPDIQKLTIHASTPYELVESTIGVATLLRQIAVRGKLFTSEDAQDEFPLRMFDGMGWEVICAQLYPSLWWQPGVFVKDGVAGHPDGLSSMRDVLPTYAHGAYDDALVVEEWKRTGKSLRVKGGKDDEYKDIRTEWMWMQQVAAYCALVSHHVGRAVRHARFHINWSCGSYTYPLTPRYFRYVVEFEPKEIAGTWAMLKAEVNYYGTRQCQ